MKARAKQDGYEEMVAMVDTSEEAVAFILSHPIIPQPGQVRTFGFSRLLMGKNK